MQRGHGAPIARAAAALGASVALHLAVLLVGGVLLVVAPLLGFDSDDPDPLIVDMIGAEAKAPVAPPPVRAARPSPPPARPVPVSLPAVAPAPPPDPAPAAVDTPPPSEAPAPPAAADATLEAGSPPAAALTEEPAPPAEDALAAKPSGAAAEEASIPGSGEATAPRESPLAATEAQAQAAQREGEVASSDQTPQTPGEPPPKSPATGTVTESPPPAEPARIADVPAPAPDSRMDLARLDAVARNPSVSARAAGEPFVGRREVFEFLLDHPEFATHVTRALRVARYRIWRTEDGLFVDDGWGATGQMFVVRAASGTRVLYARGEFQNKFLPVITGEAVVTINYDTRPAADGRDLLVAAVSSQLKIDGAFGDFVVKVASAAATEKAEKESRRLVNIFARVLRAVDEKPAALYASLRERPDVPQRELEEFRVLLKLP